MSNSRQREWFEGRVPDVVLHTAQRTMRKGAFRRGARLAACAIVRRFFEEVVAEEDGRRCLRVAEECADRIGESRHRNELRDHFAAKWLADAPAAASEAMRTGRVPDRFRWRRIAQVLLVPNRELTASCQGLAHAAVEGTLRDAVGEWRDDVGHRLRTREVSERARGEVCDLYREVFPPPFASVPDVRQFATDAIVAWARGIYDDRSHDELPMLADALEERGCDDLAVLTHLRETRSHQRGCWALDAVLEANPGTSGTSASSR